MTRELLTTTDPATGEVAQTDIRPTSKADVAKIARRARAAFDELRRSSRTSRARVLRGFADAIEDGGYLEATIDHAADTPLGPAPDLRRMLVPLGPVAVFGSSNFPFAFSVLGGDVAAAFAAGCPVIAKAHSSHPVTARRSFDALSAVAEAHGCPAAVSIVYGTDAGRSLVARPDVAAVGFTGSLDAAEALLEVIRSRPTPIPFYGELSSVNPLVVTPAAATVRGDAIADGLFESFTGSAGQLCTKPGLALVPRGADGDRIVSRLIENVTRSTPQPLLNARILDSYRAIRADLVGYGAVSVLATGEGGAGFQVGPTLLEIEAADITQEIMREAFGPLIVLVRYDEMAEASRILRLVPPSLTVTVHHEGPDLDLLEPLVSDSQLRAGRVVFNGYPTGVRVAWAQTHGGPWPATDSLHTSVGMSSIRRFLRPFTWQDAPPKLLPAELRDEQTGIPRRVDGSFIT